eukprot:11728130-Alexandrium_andersonii.AAC.2
MWHTAWKQVRGRAQKHEAKSLNRLLSGLFSAASRVSLDMYMTSNLTWAALMELASSGYWLLDVNPSRRHVHTLGARGRHSRKEAPR